MDAWVTERFAEVPKLQSTRTRGQRIRQVETHGENMERRFEVEEVVRDLVQVIVEENERARVKRKTDSAWLSKQRKKKKQKESISGMVRDTSVVDVNVDSEERDLE